MKTLGRHRTDAPTVWTEDGLRLDLPDYGEIIAYRSTTDGVLVIEIDTTDATEAASTADGQGLPRLRIYVNDDAVWEHPPYPADRSGDRSPAERAT